ncbi:family 43 glycosylhydrolase [Lachnospiraceae bacterium 54-53]
MKQKSVFFPLDDRGEPVHAHGGQIIREHEIYYWIGEDRRERNKVSCYMTSDMINWKFCNHILTIDSAAEKYYVVSDLTLDVPGSRASIGMGCNIERPKVLYNDMTKKYVMWMHWELPDNYSKARCAVAICDTIDGNYTYLGSFNPIGHMSRDCTVFQDDDGTAYFISSARENLDIHIYRLSSDYLAIEKLECVLWPGQQREAPAVFKRNGIYFMLTSGCTGWAPNQSSYAWAAHMDGPWSARKNLGNETTYNSQPAWVFQKEGGKAEWWYLVDRWGGTEGYFRSEYVLLPLRFRGDRELYLDWEETH